MVVKQWIMEYVTKYQPFLVTVYNRQTLSETCIAILNHKILESQLLGGIDLNEGNLEFILGNGDVKLMWCRTFYPHKDKMKCGLQFLSTMQQQMNTGQ